MAISQITKKLPIEVTAAQIFWAVLACLLLLKFILITNFGDKDFLATYKFMAPDSYDWLANGIRLFENDLISFRSLGLPLLIKGLSIVHGLFLLPLINQIVFFFLMRYVCKITSLVTKKQFIPYLVVIFLFLNYSFQNFANYILSDYYAILFITASLYYLFTSHCKASFVLLGISFLFQNFVLLLFPLWLGFTLYELYIPDYRAGKGVKILFRRESILKGIRRILLRTVLFFNISLIWFLYKYLKFGNPLYSQIDQFSYLSIHINSLFFYLINSYTLLGIGFFVVCGFVFWKKQMVASAKLFFLCMNISITVIFWIILYDWNDRRFLLYLIPFIYPIFGYVLGKLILTMQLKHLILLFIFAYPTTLSIDDFFNFYTLPITTDNRLIFSVGTDDRGRGDIGFPATIQRGPISYKDIVPIFGELIKRSGYLRNDENTRYSKYIVLIKENYLEKEKTICIDPAEYSLYELNAVMLMEKNSSIWGLTIAPCNNMTIHKNAD